MVASPCTLGSRSPTFRSAARSSPEAPCERPAPWEASYLERFGIHEVLAADRLRLTSRTRAGPMAIVDRIRGHAEAALGRGTPPPEEALLRGFVLGEDDRIDPATVDDFSRSGLAHLLAVSRQNVALLALLAMPLLAVLGRAPAGPAALGPGADRRLRAAGRRRPIDPARGVMGAAGIVATLAGRPRSRWYALLLAALATLALNPARQRRRRLAAQLRRRASGSSLWAARLRRPVARAGRAAGGWRARWRRAPA